MSSPEVPSAAAKVGCYSCGSRQDPALEQCGRCGSEFRRMCKCGATVSMFVSRCGSCSAPVRRPRSGRRKLPWKKMGIAAGVMVVVAGGWFAWKNRPSGSPTWRLRTEGNDQFVAGKFDQAAKTFEQLTEDDPGDAHGWYMLAASYRSLGMSADTYTSAAKKAVQADPAFTEAHILLASAAAAAGNHAEATQHAEAAVKSTRANAAAFQLLVDLILSAPEPDTARAIAVLEEARRHHFDGPIVRILLADLRLRTCETLPRETYPPEVENALRDANTVEDETLRDRFDTVELAILRARFEAALGDDRAAERRLDRARATLAPGVRAETRARLNLILGWLRWRLDAKEPARLDVAAALELDPSVAMAGEVAARLGALGAADEATALIGAAAARPGAPPALQGALAASMMGAGKLSEAGAALDAALAAAPGDPALLTMLGDLRTAQRRFDDAGQAYDAAARASPGRLDIVIRRALLPIQAAKDTEAARNAALAALDELRAAERRTGTRPEISVALGTVYLDLDDAASAAGALAQAIASAPSLPRAWALYAHALGALGRSEESLRAYARARALRPDDGALVAAEARARLDAGDPSATVVACASYLLRHPGDPGVLRIRAEAYGQLEKWAPAADDFAAASAALPADEGLVIANVDAQFRAGRLDRARAAANQAAAVLEGDAADRLRFLVELREEGAVAAVRRAEKRGASTFLAELELAAGDPASAAETARSLLAKDARNPAAARLLVHALLRSDSPPPEAIREARAAYAALAGAGDAATRDAIAGVLLLAEGDAAGAARHLAKAADVRRDDALTQFYFGEALSRSRESERGLAAMRRAVALPGVAPGMREALSRRLAAASETSEDLVRAEDLAAEATRLDPSFAPACFRLVALLLSRGDPRAAADAAVRCLALQAPGSPDAVRLRDQAVAAWLAAGEPSRARGLLEVDDDAYAARPATRIIGAFLDLRAGRVADAERVFAEFAKDAKEPAAVTGLVRCALQRGDPAAAASAVEAWAAAHPQDRDVRLTATRLLLDAGRMSEAVAVAKACREANPGDRRAAAQLVRALAQDGRQAEALAVSAAFKGGDGAAGRADARLFDAATRLTCAGDAAGALEAAHEVASAAGLPAGLTREASLLEVEALLGLGRDAEAAARCDAFVAAWPEGVPATAIDRTLEPRARFARGTIEAGRQRWAVAVEAFERCLALDSSDFAAANNLAWVLIQTPGAADRASKLSRWVTTLQPNDPNFWDTRAQCSAKVRDAADAAESWRRALEIHGPGWNPAKAGVALRFAEFLASQGRPEEAAELATSVLDAKAGPEAEARARTLLER